MLRRAGDVPGGDLGTARFETFLRRLFSVKGIVAPAVDPKIQAGVELLTPPWELSEVGLLAGWRGYEAYVNSPAVAAQYSWWELRPPATAAGGKIAVVQFVGWYPVGSTVPVCGIRDARGGGAAVTNIGVMDSRHGSISSLPAVSSFLPYQGADVGVPGTLNNTVLVNANTNTFLTPGPWVVASGFAGVRTFQIVNQTVNSGLYAYVRWWERDAEPSELATR